MKRIMTVFKVIILSLLLISSCSGNNSKDNAKKNSNPITVNNQNSNNVKTAQNEVASINETVTLNVRLFFKRVGNEEGYEITDFNTKKTYTYCYDTDSFSKLQIEGNADHITVIVKSGESGEYVHLRNENFEIKGKKIYTNKDFDVDECTIIITQNNQVLFEGRIESFGCM